MLLQTLKKEMWLYFKGINHFFDQREMSTFSFLQAKIKSMYNIKDRDSMFLHGCHNNLKRGWEGHIFLEEWHLLNIVRMKKNRRPTFYNPPSSNQSRQKSSVDDKNFKPVGNRFSRALKNPPSPQVIH